MRVRLRSVQSKLASLLRWIWGLMHDWRWWKASAIFAALWALGWWLVHVWVSKLGTDAILVRNTVSIAMIWPTYRIHRWLWRDRFVHPRKLRRRWSKTWVQLHLLNMTIYWLAIHAAGIAYMTAGVVMTVPFALLGFWRRDETDFSEEVNRTTAEA